MVQKIVPDSLDATYVSAMGAEQSLQLPLQCCAAGSPSQTHAEGLSQVKRIFPAFACP